MKGIIDKLRFKWKVFAFLLGFCALLLVILWLFQTVFLDAFYRNIRAAEVKRYAGAVAAEIDSEDIGDIIDMLSSDIDAVIEVVTPDGRAVYPAVASRSEPAKDKSAMAARALENGGEYYEFISPRLAQAPNNTRYVPRQYGARAMQQLVYVKVANGASGEALAIVISAGVLPVNATVQTLRYQLYYITVIMLLLSVVLAFILARRVSRPIEDINRSAKALAGGDYSARFEGKGFREVSELSDTLNTAAAELNKVENLRRELMANVSHDMRTPLSLIYSYAEMMHDFPDEITPGQTRVIMDETRRLNSLVSDMFDLSRLEAGIQQLSLSECCITGMIRAAVDRMAELMRMEGYHITFECDGDVRACADEVKITQAFYNLLLNAVNYTGEDKAVSVRQVTEQGRVRIEIADTGDGVKEEDLPYIWDRYYKVAGPHKRAVTGTGLGLSIVKKVVTLHGGQYGVEQRPERGSIFWFSLNAYE